VVPVVAVRRSWLVQSGDRADQAQNQIDGHIPVHDEFDLLGRHLDREADAIQLGIGRDLKLGREQAVVEVDKWIDGRGLKPLPSKVAMAEALLRNSVGLNATMAIVREVLRYLRNEPRASQRSRSDSQSCLQRFLSNHLLKRCTVREDATWIDQQTTKADCKA
jgi:hypothetical protein